MQIIKKFIKPDWRKTLLFVAFALIAVGGHIQSWAFSDVPPKPPLYDLLSPFPFWPMWMELLFPLVILSIPLRLIGIDIMSGPFWLFVVANGLYFYLLACLLVASFEHYGHRFPKWAWAMVVTIPLALSLLGLIVHALQYYFYLPLPTSLEALPYFLGSLLTAVLYLYLLFCLGFFAYDKIKRRDLAA